MITEPEPIHTDLWHRDGEEIHILQDQVAPTQVGTELDAKGLLLRDALAIVTVVGALAAFYGMIKLVSYLAGIPSPSGRRNRSNAPRWPGASRSPRSCPKRRRSSPANQL